jgi:hypothetical protein
LAPSPLPYTCPHFAYTSHYSSHHWFIVFYLHWVLSFSLNKGIQLQLFSCCSSLSWLTCHLIRESFPNNSIKASKFLLMPFIHTLSCFNSIHCHLIHYAIFGLCPNHLILPLLLLWQLLVSELHEVMMGSSLFHSSILLT